MFGLFKKQEIEMEQRAVTVGSVPSVFTESSSSDINAISTAYACIRLLANNTAMTYLRHIEKIDDGAEELITAERGNIPITIYRPSQIIGESLHGRTRKFVGFYEFIKLAERGKLRILIADPNARTDMVPSDYVCDAMLYLCTLPQAIGRTYHLAAGLDRSISVEHIVQCVFEELQFGNDVNKVVKSTIIPANQLELEASIARRYHSSALKLLMGTYLPYLSYERDFDVTETRQLLESAGIKMSPIDQVVRIATRYAINSGYSDACGLSRVSASKYGIS